MLGAALCGAVACHPPPPGPGPRGPVAPTPTPAAAVSDTWAREVLARLSLEEKAAQMVGVRAFGLHRHPRSAERRELLRLVAELRVGALVVFDSEYLF